MRLVHGALLEQPIRPLHGAQGAVRVLGDAGQHPLALLLLPPAAAGLLGRASRSRTRVRRRAAGGVLVAGGDRVDQLLCDRAHQPHGVLGGVRAEHRRRVHDLLGGASSSPAPPPARASPRAQGAPCPATAAGRESGSGCSSSSPIGRPAARPRSSSADPKPRPPSPARRRGPCGTAATAPWPAATAGSRAARRSPNSSRRSPHHARSARRARPARLRTNPPARDRSAPPRQETNLARGRREHARNDPGGPGQTGVFQRSPRRAARPARSRAAARRSRAAERCAPPRTARTSGARCRRICAERPRVRRGRSR